MQDMQRKVVMFCALMRRNGLGQREVLDPLGLLTAKL